MNALVPVPSVGEIVTVTRYQVMREAVAATVTVDEAKEWVDRASAAAFYAHQIRDREVETWLTEIKRRAEYRLGEILLKIEPSKGGASTHRTASTVAPSVRRTVIDLGIEPATATRLMQLAGPRDEDLQAVGRAAAEDFYAAARATQEPPTRKALQAHITAAVQAAMGPTEIRRAYRGLVREDLAVKATRRAEREEGLAGRSRRAGARLGATLYPVLYADPPWDYEAWSAETGKGRAAANHYPTMSLDEICALQVPAAPSAVLFLWVPANLVPVGCRVVEAWGFDYRTHVVWRKPHPITGYWFRSRHELLYVATRGHGVPAPALGTQPESVINAALPARRHSAKPDDFAQLIADLYPTCDRLELFAREARPGWAVWGNEVEPDDEATSTADEGGAARLAAGPDARAAGETA